MLVLSRKQGERVVIGRNIVVTVTEAKDGRVRLGFEAPQGTPILRQEVLERIARAEAMTPAEERPEESQVLLECH